MIQPTAGFIVYGVHKDGLKDPMGVPFIDDAIVKRSKRALTQAGLKVVQHDLVIASKEESRSALKKMKSDDRIDMVVEPAAIDGTDRTHRRLGQRRPNASSYGVARHLALRWVSMFALSAI